MNYPSSEALKRPTDSNVNRKTGIYFDPLPEDKVGVKNPPSPSNPGGRSYA